MAGKKTGTKKQSPQKKESAKDTRFEKKSRGLASEGFNITYPDGATTYCPGVK